MPIKLHNERLPGKNTMLLGGKPLLVYALDSICATQMVDDVYVYCSNNRVEKFLPINVLFLKRPEYLDLPTSNFTQIFECFMNTIDADVYIYIHATAPFIEISTIKKCIESVLFRGFDSAFCATRIQDFLWKDGKPLNFDAANLPRSQDLKPIYRETSGVYVFTKDVFLKYKRRIGERPYIHEVNYKEAIDINNLDDFRLAEVMLNIEI